MTQQTSEYFFRHLIISLFFLGFIHSAVFAQEEDENTPPKKKVKKEKEPLYFSGARVGLEMLHLAENIFGTDRTGFEMNADVAVSNKFFLVVDLGTEKYTRSDVTNNYTYTNSGQYLRIGIDYNLLHKKTADEAVSFGLRYASANFKHDLNYTLSDDFWGDASGNIEEQGLSANWVEFVASFKVKIIKNLYLSPNFRIKFLGGSKGNSSLTIADIPGYGVAKSNTKASVNYSLLYRLPLGIKN